jgi:hypothetical protein
MAGDSSLLTEGGLIILRRFLIAVVLLGLFAAGFWVLNQTMDAVVLLHRAYVEVPFYPAPIDVWTYHDYGFALLWVAYVGLILWEITPWKPGRLTSGRVLIGLFGFALLTAGLWLSQDAMNAELVLHRSFVDLPFFLTSVDLYVTRDLAVLLVGAAFVGFYALIRVSKRE